MSKPYEHLIKIILIGDAGTNKTKILLKFADDGQQQGQFISTIGCDFKIRDLEAHGHRIRLQIWDTAGNETFFTITSSYYRGTKGIFLVYDVTNEKSFHNVKSWMGNISEVTGKDAVVILLGNNCHLKNDERQVSWERGYALAKEMNVKFFEVSADTGTNVEEALKSLVLDVLAKVY
ncbi:ras-related protein Rab-8B-like [Macrobrachium nipponense]|uniref:ras-related protein Rab-8B-like n=1 Tax=Macrobrachium nipponense TaxID=159736 RepID=UPI0030C7DC98